MAKLTFLARLAEQIFIANLAIFAICANFVPKLFAVIAFCAINAEGNFSAHTANIANLALIFGREKRGIVLHILHIRLFCVQSVS